MPKVTVVLPCYNYGRFLPDAIASLVGGETSLGAMPGQTLKDFEAIIVDDESQDDTEKIARTLTELDSRIRYLRMQRNGGTAAALNAGIAEARSPHISILSADDMARPDYLQKMLAAYRQQNTFSYCNLQMFSDGKLGNEMRFGDYRWASVPRRCPGGPAQAFSKEAWAIAGGFPPIMRYGREDWAMFIALGYVGYTGVHIREPLYLYRREEQNRSLRNKSPEWVEFFRKQFQYLWPGLYCEETKMCCGQSAAKRQPAKQPARGRGGVANLPGRAGMARVRYTGSAMGSKLWQGKPSNTKYNFGGKQLQGYIDRDDLPWFLARVEGGETCFVELPDEPPPVAPGVP